MHEGITNFSNSGAELSSYLSIDWAVREQLMRAAVSAGNGKNPVLYEDLLRQRGLLDVISIIDFKSPDMDIHERISSEALLENVDALDTELEMTEDADYADPEKRGRFLDLYVQHYPTDDGATDPTKMRTAMRHLKTKVLNEAASTRHTESQKALQQTTTGQIAIDLEQQYARLEALPTSHRREEALFRGHRMIGILHTIVAKHVRTNAAVNEVSTEESIFQVMSQLTKENLLTGVDAFKDDLAAHDPHTIQPNLYNDYVHSPYGGADPDVASITALGDAAGHLELVIGTSWHLK